MTRKRSVTAAVLIWSALLACKAAALDVIVISDLNGSYGSIKYDARVDKAIERIIEIDPDLVVSTGDMVAGQRIPNLSDKQVREMWKAFHKAVSDPLEAAGIPFAVTPGNHDASAYRGFERERKIYAEEWAPRKPDVDFWFRMTIRSSTRLRCKASRLRLWMPRPLGRYPAIRRTNLRSWGRMETRLSLSVTCRFGPSRSSANAKSSVTRHLRKSTCKAGSFCICPATIMPSTRGWKDGVAYVSQACLGGGPRRLIGSKARSPHSFTHVTFQPNGEFGIAVYRGPNFERSVNFKSLPKEIRSPNAVLKRLDLVK